MKKLYYKGHPYAVMEDADAERLMKEMKGQAHVKINGAWLKTISIEILNDETLLDEDKESLRKDKFRRNVIDWESDWKERVLWTFEQKAESNYGYFAAWWYVHTQNKQVPKEIWQEAKKRSIEFFAVNHHRTLTKPDLWKDLFPESSEPKHEKGMAHVRELLQKRLLHHLQMAFSEDARMGMRT